MGIRKNKYIKWLMSALMVLMGTTSVLYGTVVNKSEEKKEGFQNEDKRDTVYGIGSVSKMYVTTAIMQLVQEGKIDLDMSITHYLPEFQMTDERYKDITVRMLLNHSSGLMGFTFSNNILYMDNDQNAHDTMLEKLKEQRLKADPGQYSTYCNDGFTVAEIIVERVSGQTFTDYLREHIWEPLEMKQSGTSLDLMDSDKQVATYFDKSILYATEYCNVFASGGILSTAEEVCKFGQTFMRDNNGLLSDETLAQMKVPVAKTNQYGYVAEGSCDNYGLGWDSVDAYPFNEYGITALVKGGDLLNQHGVLMVMPDENISVSVLSSGGESTFNELLAEELAQIVLEEKGIMKSDTIDEDSSIASDWLNEHINKKVPEEYLKYEGNYANGQGIYHMSFPNKEYLQLEACDTEIKQVQKYYYLENGKFISEDGNFISTSGLATANGKQNGTTFITLNTEKDNKEYICMESTINYEEIGDRKVVGMFAEKMETFDLEESVLEAWRARENKKYYLVSEKYSSASWNTCPMIKLNLSTEMDGYLNAYGLMHTTRITDANHSKAFVTLTGGAGRDLTDISISKVNGIEEINLDDLALKYVEEASIPLLDLSQKEIMLNKKGAVWYSISDKDAKKELYINPSDKMSVYVYNKYDECIYSTYMINMGNRVILPEQGKLVVVGEAGAKLQLKEK